MSNQFIGYVVAETPRAFLFLDHFWDDPEWMPKSQSTLVRFEGTHEVVLSASKWICEQKQLEEFVERVAPEGEDDG